jgi:5-formyltetrahydrofolate cyclo-ligase
MTETVAHVGEHESNLRARMQDVRDSLDPLDRLRFGEAIDHRLDELEPFRQAETIGVYYSTGSEVPTGGLIQRIVELEGRRAFLPFLLNGELEMTEWRPSDPLEATPVVGLHPRFRHSVPLQELDVMVVPGLAFDESGRRLRSDSGHYDRLLGRLPRDVTRIGLAFSALVVHSFEVDVQSEPVDFVVTDGGIHRSIRRASS